MQEVPCSAREGPQCSIAQRKVVHSIPTRVLAAGTTWAWGKDLLKLVDVCSCSNDRACHDGLAAC